ncbi:MAG: hypothetical protein WCC94_11990 [Candidatus Bathyarchaeia archaeon]
MKTTNLISTFKVIPLIASEVPLVRSPDAVLSILLARDSRLWTKA